jgi:hypothetical protein
MFRMPTVRVLTHLDPPIAVNLKGLPTSFEIGTSLGTATIELPRVEYVEEDGEVVMAPASARAAADRIGHEKLFRRHANGWGWSWQYNPLTGEGSAYIGAVVASITVDDAAIERKEYRRGVWAPDGEAIRQLRLDLDDWRTRFVDWVSLIAGQAVSPLTPPVPDPVRSEADGTVIWVEDPDLVGVPSTSSHHLIVQDEPEDESAGFLLDGDMLELIRQLVDTREQPTTQLRLLRNARVAIRRGEHRLALVELGSAAELCLWNLYDTPSPRSTPQERQSWTLGTLVRKLYPPPDSRSASLRMDLVEPRNDAIHRAVESDRTTALAAFALVRQLVSNELPYPLPTI